MEENAFPFLEDLMMTFEEPYTLLGLGEYTVSQNYYDNASKFSFYMTHHWNLLKQWHEAHNLLDNLTLNFNFYFHKNFGKLALDF